MTAAKFHQITTTGDAAGNVLTSIEYADQGRGSVSGTLDVVPPAKPIRITAHVARRLLREVVADFGQHHRSLANSYVLDRCPACMVGAALYRAGVSEQELADMDRLAPSVIGDVKLPARVWMSKQARWVFAAAQRVQDNGQAWGPALDAALAVPVLPIVKWRPAVAA